MITITLKPDEWQQIVNVLAQAPYHVAAPLITQIQQQANASTQTMGAMPLPARGNGHAEAPPP